MPHASDKPIVVQAMSEKRRFTSMGDAEFWMRTNLPYNETAVAIDTRRARPERSSYFWNTKAVPHVLERGIPMVRIGETKADVT